MPAAWHAALAFALVGERHDLGLQPAPDADALVAQLAGLGWDAAAVRAYALRRSERAEPWPVPVPDALRAGLGAAQWYAALGAVRDRLGVATLDERAPSRRTALTADERRLLTEVPPHYGRT